MKKIISLAVLCAVAIAGFFIFQAQPVQDPKWEQPTMGTLCHITISGAVEPEALEQLRAEIDAKLEHVNRLMSTWQTDTEISQFNDFQSLEKFPVSPDFAAVVQRALEFSSSTDGAFDPTVKPLVDHWGFGPEADAASIPEILQSVGWQKVRVENGALIKTMPKIQLDLSAIAKGYGVDAVADVIRSVGRENFLVEIGGEIVADGVNPSGQAWRVGVESPEPLSPGIYRVIEFDGNAMATSGDYRRFRTREDGTRYSHIIDPISGMPAETDVASVTVLAGSCMDADAAATALFVMGSERGFQWLENHPELQALFILHAADQTFVTRTTPGFPE
jgi:thiamine biosynthesis lipoprotein